MRGRKAFYSDPAEMQRHIDAYFTACKGEYQKTADGQYALDKHGNPRLINARPPTINGLVQALGFGTRKSLSDYQRKAAFRKTVTVAKMRIEQYAEERLFDRDGFSGARFTLVCNFGWKPCPDEPDNADEDTGTVRIVYQ